MSSLKLHTRPECAIEIDNLTVSYRGGCPAVHHLSAEFAAGTMCAVFGPNGAGKSTLLKAVLGLIRCNTGIDRSQPMTVFELAAMGLWYEIGFFGRVSTEQRRRAQAALERVEMAEFAERGISELSNGQFQRVLFARMLVQNARFLLLDEPFNAVDAKTTYALLEVLRQENQNGRAVIAVLHDYEQVRAYFPRTLLIAREKVADGKTEDVLCDSLLAQANALAQRHGSSEWCATA